MYLKKRWVTNWSGRLLELLTELIIIIVIIIMIMNTNIGNERNSRDGKGSDLIFAKQNSATRVFVT